MSAPAARVIAVLDAIENGVAGPKPRTVGLLKLVGLEVPVMLPVPPLRERLDPGTAQLGLIKAALLVLT
jgi:hypothetical protein